jgi:hypothetical protein
MTQKFTGYFSIFVMLVSLALSPRSTSGQERELPLDRILNPLPDFDPFEKPPAAPQFFPDDVDKRARDILVDALIGRKESLEENLKYLQSEDAKLQKQRGTSTGLTEPTQDLINNTIQDRERYLAAQKEALKTASSPERKKYLESIINQDDLNQSDQLIRQGTTNYWGGVVNRLLGSVDLVGVASGNYIGAAAETVINQLYALADRDMPIEERRALARDLDHLKRYPDDPRNPEIRKQVESLDQRKKSVLVQKQLDKAKDAISKNDLETAVFHAQVASFIDPQSKDAEKTLQQATKLANEQQVARTKALVAAREKTLPAEQQADVKKLIEALTLRDQPQVERLAAQLEMKYKGKPLSDAVRDAAAVALEMKGEHEQAKKDLERLARSSVTTEGEKRATTLLQNPEYNLLATFQDARDERRLQSAKYVLLGEDLLKKNLLYAAGAMAAAGPAGAVTLGTINAILMGTNLVKVVTNNPISAQPVIDAGVAYVRNHPNSENASEVYKVLAEAYEEKGMLDKAIDYYELAGPAMNDKVASLKESAAKNFLEAANKNKDRATQESYLKTILDVFPDSASAAQATKKLAELVKDENRGLRMSKQFLMENPELYGPRGLGLKESLFDGNSKNMELAERGVNLLSDNEVLLYYQTPWGVRSQTYLLPRPVAERFFVTLREKNQEIAKADVNERAKGSVGGIKNLPIQVVRGDQQIKSETAEERDDTTFSLIRDASGSGPAYPRVLDSELLSENERDPGSKYRLPPMQGSISPNHFSMTGNLPTGLWGNQLAVGTDQKGGFAGVQVPIPLLQGFIPVDFMVQGRFGGFSVYPKIHTSQSVGEDPELYR